MSYDVGKPSGMPWQKMSYDGRCTNCTILKTYITILNGCHSQCMNHGYPLAAVAFSSRVVDRNPSGTAPKVQLSWRRRGTLRSFFEAANDRNVITTWVARDPNNLNFFKEIQLRQQKCRDCTDGELIERTLVPYSTHGQHLDSRKPTLAVAVGDHL